jgi:hypothetical protein
MAQAKEDRGGHFLHSLQAHATPARSSRQSAPKRHRTFCKLKNWRPKATRYDGLARNYLSGLALAAIIIVLVRLFDFAPSAPLARHLDRPGERALLEPLYSNSEALDLARIELGI